MMCLGLNLEVLMSKNNIDKVIEKCLLAAGKHPERADDNMIISLTKGECKTIYEALTGTA